MKSVVGIESEAARWILRRGEPIWSNEDQAQLDEWLASSSAHRVAYYRLEYGWQKTDRLAALRCPPKPSVKPAAPNRRRLLAIAASIAVATAGVALFLATYSSDGTRYVTGVGDHKTVTLNDGSQVQLNTATRLRAEVTKQSRVVWLDAGEAYFEVKHQAGRPFVVYAGDRRVTVLGTKFSVRRIGTEVKVNVLEGRVRVEGPQDIAATPAIVEPGAELLAHGESTVLVPISIDKVAAELTWRSGLLTFDGTSLGDAVEEFNRYSQQRLIVDPRAVDTRIGGVFEASNVDGFVRLLHEAYGLRVEQNGNEIRISP